MNGKPDLGEECDDNNLKNDDACTTMCRTAICGDGHLCSDPLTCTTGPDGGREQCDDGNAVSGDGCSMTCAIESDSICRADPGRESLCRADNQVSFQGAERVDPPVTALPTEEYRGVGREVSLVTYHGRLFAGWTEQYRTFATDGGAHPFVRRVRVAAMTDIPTSKQFYWESVEGTAVPGLNSVSGREGQNIKFFLFGDRLYVTWTEWQVGDINTMRIAVYNDNDANPSWVSIDAQKPFFVKLGGLFSVSALPMILNGELLMVWETDTAVHLAAYNGNDAAPDWTERTSWHPTDGTGNVDLLSSVVFNGKLYISYVHYALSGASRHVDVYTPETPSQPWSHVEGAGLGLPGVNACKQPQLSVQAQSLTLSCLAYRDIQPGNLASITYNGNDAAPAWVGMLRSNLIPALNYTLTTFNGNTYIAWLEQWVQNSMDSDPTKLRISIADSSSSLQSWSAVDGGSLNAVFGSWGQGMSFATLGNTIFIGWAEASGNVEWGKIHILRAQSR